jgi:hypothetical protein
MRQKMQKMLAAHKSVKKDLNSFFAGHIVALMGQSKNRFFATRSKYCTFFVNLMKICVKENFICILTRNPAFSAHATGLHLRGNDRWNFLLHAFLCTRFRDHDLLRRLDYYFLYL